MKGIPPKVIWIRSGNLTNIEIVKLLSDNKEIISNFCKESETEEDSCLELD